MTHFLLLTTNRSGVLSRITALLSSVGANIETAEAYPLLDSGMAVVHIRAEADATCSGRLTRKLSRLVDVIEVHCGGPGQEIAVEFGAQL